MAITIHLDADTPSIIFLSKADKRLAKLISMVGPLTYTLHANNSYAFLVHEIIEQMLSISAGSKIYSNLESLCGGEINPSSINRLTDEQIRSTGTSSSKVGYIRALTKAVSDGTLDFERLNTLTDSEVSRSLLSIRGIGNWTAKMYLIFALDRQDILPFEDTAFQQSFKWLYKTTDCSMKIISKKSSKWKPYSSIASRYLYRALDMGLTNNEFHLYK